MVTTSSSRTVKATTTNGGSVPPPPPLPVNTTSTSMNHSSSGSIGSSSSISGGGGSNTGTSGHNTNSSPFVTRNTTTTVVTKAGMNGTSKHSTSSFPHPTNRMSSSHKTKQISQNNNSNINMHFAASSGIKHNVVPVMPSSSMSKSNNALSSIYLDALQTLNEENMSRACSLLLAPITLNETEVDHTDATMMMNDSKSSIIDDADIIETTAINGIERKDSQRNDDDNDPATATSLNPIRSNEHNEIIKAISSTIINGEESSLTKPRNIVKAVNLPSACPELKQLQQIYKKCRQAAVTLEKEIAILARQQQQQQSQLQQKQQRTVPQLPLPTTSSSTTATSIVPGMISGRTKIVGRDGGGGGGGNMTRHNHHGVVPMRTGSMKRPLPASSSSLSSAVATGQQYQSQQSIHPPSSKGLFGSMLSSNSKSHMGVPNRQRLERERSDSSMSTSGIPSSSTHTSKKSRLSIGDSSTLPPPQLNGNIVSDDTSVPPPNARQFLAMLNSNSDSTQAKATTLSQTPSSSRRKSSIDSSTKKAEVNVTTNDEDPIKETTAATSSIVDVESPRRQSPEKRSASTKATITTSPPSTRVQPPRASRK